VTGHIERMKKAENLYGPLLFYQRNLCVGLIVCLVDLERVRVSLANQLLLDRIF